MQSNDHTKRSDPLLIDKHASEEEYEIKINLRGELIVQSGKHNKPTVTGLLNDPDTTIVRLWDRT